MASLFKAVRNFFREKKDDAAEALSDPVRDAKYDIQDSKKQIEEFERKVAQLMATNNQIKRKQSNAKEEVKKWTGLAQKAAEAGSESDVTTAITKKQAAANEATAYGKEIKANEKIIASLRSQLTRARAKIAKAESGQAQLAARLEGAKVRKELSNASSGFGDGPLAALDDLEKAVDAAECEADAYDDLHDDAGEDLEEKYGSGDTNVDDEVAKLMASAK
jgi:phage shock protein A